MSTTTTNKSSTRTNGTRPKVSKLKQTMVGNKIGRVKPTITSSSSSSASITKKTTAAPSSSLTRKKNSKKKREQNNVEAAVVDDEIHATAADSGAPVSGYGNGMGGGMMMPGMGMGMMGMPGGMYGMGGMGMGGMGMGGMGMMGMGNGGGGGMGQYIFSLNQFLFGIQSCVFSLGQAVQIVGMNAQQIKGVYDSLKGLLDNALEWAQDNYVAGISNKTREVMSGLMKIEGNHDDDDVDVDRSCTEGEDRNLTQADIIRRRRLAAFRWTMTLGVSYFLYRAVRRMLRGLIYGGASRGANQYHQHQQQHRGAIPQNNGSYGSGNLYGGNNTMSYGNGIGNTSGYSNGHGMDRYSRGGSGYHSQRHQDHYSQGYGNDMGGQYY